MNAHCAKFKKSGQLKGGVTTAMAIGAWRSATQTLRHFWLLDVVLAMYVHMYILLLFRKDSALSAEFEQAR